MAVDARLPWCTTGGLAGSVPVPEPLLVGGWLLLSLAAKVAAKEVDMERCQSTPE